MNPNDNLPPGVTARDIDGTTAPRRDVCPDCDGEGHTVESNCCGAGFSEPGWPDNDICERCHDHAEPCECERCNGTGSINVEAEREQRKAEAEEAKADMARDDAALGHPGSDVDRYLDRHPLAEFKENE